MRLTSKAISQTLWYLGTQAHRHTGTVLLVLLFPAAALACPLCKEILMDPGKLSETLSTAKGYALSIGVMLSIPALLIGGVTLLIVRSHRRKPLG